MSQPALPPPNTARLAITSFCTVLSQLGVTSLEPELIRQAKFDGPVSVPLWQVLHDTVLVVLAGCPGGTACQTALSRQWSQVALELPGEEFPHEGAALVLRQLAVWGAPQELLKELRPRSHLDPDPQGNPDKAIKPDHELGGTSWPRCRSRPLLLALGWLTAAAGLFERRIGELEPGPALRALLPPYPQDACVSPAVQAAYDSAARDAREHVRKLPAGAIDVAPAAGAGRGPASARGRSGAAGSGQDPFGPSAVAEALWADVEAAAQRAVMLCGRVRSRMVVLQSATDCRNRLAHSLWASQAAAAPSVRPLTPYELQLCGQPAAMQRHMTALETATLALLDQQELAAHGALFFEWLGSVITEEQQYQQQLLQQHQNHHGGAGGRRVPPGAPYRAQTGLGGKAGGGAAAGGAGGALSSLEHLPHATTDAAARLAAQLQAQLDAAVQAAEPEVAAAQRRAADRLRQGSGGGRGDGPGGGLVPQPHQPPALTIDHFLSLAERAIPEQQFDDYDSLNDGGSACAGEGGAGLGDGPSTGLPLLGLGAGGGTAVSSDAGAWRLPDDLAAALSAVQAAERNRRCTEEDELACFERLRYAALARYDFSGSGASTSPLGPPPQPGSGASVPVKAETQRLLAVVLAAARPLARTRATHKAALMAALQELPEGFLVAGV